MTVEALRIAIQHLHQSPHDSKVYDEVAQALVTATFDDGRPRNLSPDEIGHVW